MTNNKTTDKSYKTKSYYVDHDDFFKYVREYLQDTPKETNNSSFKSIKSSNKDYDDSSDEEFDNDYEYY